LNVPAEKMPRDFVDAVVAQNLFAPLLVPFAMLLNTSFAFGVEYGRGALDGLNRPGGWGGWAPP
jgi:hypothetical protein